jgi:hypothetical protein
MDDGMDLYRASNCREKGSVGKLLDSRDYNIVRIPMKMDIRDLY